MKSVQMGGFGFGIPVGSVINKVSLGLKAYSYMTGQILSYGTGFYFVLGVNSDAVFDVNQTQSGSCPNASFKTAQLFYSHPTVDDLNSEAFTARLDAWNLRSGISNHYVDAVYVEVDYSLPVVAGGRVTDGFVSLGMR